MVDDDCDKMKNDKIIMFIENLQKNKYKRLSFYAEKEIIDSFINLPKDVEVIIKSLNKKVLYLLKYLYLNFFDDILKYLNLPQINKVDFEESNFLNRYDLFFDKNGNPKVVEFNMDVAWWYLETLIMNDLEIWKLFLNNMIAWIKKFLVNWNVFIISSNSYREDYKIALFIKEILKNFLDIDAEIISPIQLSLNNNWYLYFWDIKIDNLLRYYPWDRFLPLDTEIKTNVINPIQSFVFQQKSLFSFMWENIGKFNDDIKKIIEELIPYSVRLDKVDDLNNFIINKDYWVLKYVNDREGNNIFIWSCITESWWRQVIQKVLRDNKNYIFQKKNRFW